MFENCPWKSAENFELVKVLFLTSSQQRESAKRSAFELACFALRALMCSHALRASRSCVLGVLVCSMRYAC